LRKSGPSSLLHNSQASRLGDGWVRVSLAFWADDRSKGTPCDLSRSCAYAPKHAEMNASHLTDASVVAASVQEVERPSQPRSMFPILPSTVASYSIQEVTQSVSATQDTNLTVATLVLPVIHKLQPSTCRSGHPCRSLTIPLDPPRRLSTITADPYVPQRKLTQGPVASFAQTSVTL
jgi:hypothetical protein